MPSATDERIGRAQDPAEHVIAVAAVEAVAAGAAVLVISDRSVSADRAPIPSLLALGAVHHRLVAEHTRQQASIVVASGDARDVHGVACLLGFGADAVCPRLALETVASMADDDQLGELHSSEAQAKLQAALEDGVLKIFSKMGISTVDGYRAAQIFEAIGLGPEVIETCLRFTVSEVGGVGFDTLGADILGRHEAAFAGEKASLDEPGFFRYRKRGGEYHGNNPDVVDALHDSLGLTPEGDGENGERKPKKKSEASGELAGVEPAPSEDHGKVIVLQGPDAEP